MVKQMLTSSFNLTIESQVDRSLRAKIHNIIPHQYFSRASAETKDMFISGHYYGCISLCQAISESLSRFICLTNKVQLTKDYDTRIIRLFKKNLISLQARSAFINIWGSDRNTFHHLNEDVVTDLPNLMQRAEECINNLYDIESEIFAYEIVNNKISPKHPIYWPKPINGEMPIHLKPNF